jgi:hypothetical protein
MRELIFKYYGIDWAIFLILIFHLWFIGEKRRFAFLFGAAASILGIFFAFLVDSVAMILMNSVFCVMHLIAYAKWNLK